MDLYVSVAAPGRPLLVFRGEVVVCSLNKAWAGPGDLGMSVINIKSMWPNVSGRPHFPHRTPEHTYERLILLLQRLIYNHDHSRTHCLQSRIIQVILWLIRNGPASWGVYLTAKDKEAKGTGQNKNSVKYQGSRHQNT